MRKRLVFDVADDMRTRIRHACFLNDETINAFLRRAAQAELDRLGIPQRAGKPRPKQRTAAERERVAAA
jgi:hypothetical protein